MAQQNTQPATQQLIWQVSASQSYGNAPNPSKFIAKNPDGTVKDLSALTALHMNVTKSGYGNGQFDINVAITPTIDVADNSGVTCHFAEADPATVAGGFGAPGSYQYMIYGTDGTNQYLVAQGTLNLAFLS